MNQNISVNKSKSLLMTGTIFYFYNNYRKHSLVTSLGDFRISGLLTKGREGQRGLKDEEIASSNYI